jgi:hypothetical protein
VKRLLLFIVFIILATLLLNVAPARSQGGSSITVTGCAPQVAISPLPGIPITCTVSWNLNYNTAQNPYTDIGALAFFPSPSTSLTGPATLNSSQIVMTVSGAGQSVTCGGGGIPSVSIASHNPIFIAATTPPTCGFIFRLSSANLPARGSQSAQFALTVPSLGTFPTGLYIGQLEIQAAAWCSNGALPCP